MSHPINNQPCLVRYYFAFAAADGGGPDDGGRGITGGGVGDNDGSSRRSRILPPLSAEGGGVVLSMGNPSDFASSAFRRIDADVRRGGDRSRQRGGRSVDQLLPARGDGPGRAGTTGCTTRSSSDGGGFDGEARGWASVAYRLASEEYYDPSSSHGYAFEIFLDEDDVATLLGTDIAVGLDTVNESTNS